MNAFRYIPGKPIPVNEVVDGAKRDVGVIGQPGGLDAEECENR